MPKAAPHPDTEISNKKYCETTIGELRKAYGADFAMPYSIQDEQDKTCDQQNGRRPRYRKNQSLRCLVVT